MVYDVYANVVNVVMGGSKLCAPGEHPNRSIPFLLFSQLRRHQHPGSLGHKGQTPNKGHCYGKWGGGNPGDMYIYIYLYLYPLAFSNDPISHISLNPQWWDARMLLTTTWLIILGILEWSIGKWICKTQKLLSQKLHARKIYQTGVFPLFRIVFLKFSTVGQLGNTATSVTDRHYMSHPCLTKAKLEITLGWV